MTLAGTTLQRHTDSVDGFTRPACKVTPKLVTEGNAQLAIVRHNLGSPTLGPDPHPRGKTKTRASPTPQTLDAAGRSAEFVVVLGVAC
jgi:hypothetical protein